MNPSETPPAGLGEGSDRTQKLILSDPGEPPIRTLKISQPAEAAGQTHPPRAQRRPPQGGGWKLPLVLGVLVALGALGYFLLARGPSAPAPVAPAAAQDPVPPGAVAYLDQARSGDAHAMRMLGVMYYYGLNVPQDREKGLYWYRRAAEQGSDAARAELAKIEGSR